MGCLYIIINLRNWKVYIGKWKSMKVEYRWNQHKKGNGNEHIFNSIKKYGVEYFYFGVLYENVPHEFLGDLEKKEIARYNCNSCRGGWGYNKTDGDEGTSGWKASVEQRRKNSESRMGKSLSEEHCRNISEGRKGIIFTEEHLKNLSNAKIRPEYDEAHDMFFSFPSDMPVMEKCERLYAKHPNIPKGTIYTWTLKWCPRPRQRKPEYDEAKCFFFLLLPPDMPVSEKRQQLYAKYPNIKGRTIRYWVRQWQSIDK